MSGITYVMTHPGFRSIKVGYARPDARRIGQLMRRGWQPYRTLIVQSPQMARRIEQATLFELRHRLHVPVHLTRAHMGRAGGWTETVSAERISPSDVWDLVCEQGAIEQLAPIVKPVWQPRGPLRGHRRQQGDTPRYVRAARIEAARTARAAQVGAPNQTKPNPKKATKKDTP